MDDNLDVKNRPENQGLRKTLLQAPLAFYQKLGADLQAGADSSPEDQTRLADSYYKLATLNREIGSQADALKEYGEAVAILDALVPVVPESMRADTHDKLAKLLAELGTLQSVSNGLNEASMESYPADAPCFWIETLVHEKPQNVEHRASLARLLVNIASSQALAGKVDPALESLDRGADRAGGGSPARAGQCQRGRATGASSGSAVRCSAATGGSFPKRSPRCRTRSRSRSRWHWGIPNTCRQLVLSEIYAALAHIRRKHGRGGGLGG